MIVNVLFVFLSGVVTLLLSSVPALFGGDLSPTLLVISFVWGVFVGLFLLRYYGSVAAIWRYWGSPPR